MEQGLQGLQELMDAADAADSADDILQWFAFAVEEKLYSSNIAALATALHDELVKRFETLSAGERLAAARAARAAFRKAAQAASDASLANAVEHDWEPWRAKAYYFDHPEKRPANSKYPLAECIQESKSGAQGATPSAQELTVEGDDEI